MKNNKKLIFIDFDGTFFDHSIKGVPESTKDALMKVKENKLADLYLTTGRTYVYLKNHLEYTKYFDNKYGLIDGYRKTYGPVKELIEKENKHE